MVVDLTVAIPTYNGERRLPEVLERLQSSCKDVMLRSLHSEDFSWEVIVVDNNSTDDTAKVVQAYQVNWPKQYPLKYYFEPKQGAAFARHRAFQEARGTLVGFLDDDNIPAPDWVLATYKFAQEHPAAGAYGSQIHGVFEVSPPENFERLAPFLAITERGSTPLRYEPQKKVLPPSAGLVVRKQAWLESVPSQLILSGRTPSSMVTSEDLEMLSYIQAKGWEIWYNPAMQIDHKIPHWRLEREYLIPFFRGIGLSRHVTRMLSVKSWQRPIATLAYMTNDLRKIAVHLLKHGTRVQSDLIAACETQLFVSSLISPFYLWQHGYFDSKD
ncbi:MAG: glycosyltransferase family 2 protein [Microcoleus sp. SIO2G3]|nr:glycosyltransferase family 2 protein [Microcoleus sp. SIO2G3]